MSTLEEEPTITSEEQHRTELTVTQFTSEPYEVDGLRLHRDAHIAYLRRGLTFLSSGWSALDASRPWLLYWMLHSLDLLAADDAIRSVASSTIDFLRRCQHPRGGFGGGPGQIPHLAPTYAAVNALAIVGEVDEAAYRVVDRQKMAGFLHRMKNPSNGSFRMHQDGETDIRGMYTALSVADMLGIDIHSPPPSSPSSPRLADGCATHIRSCQTYEGGIGAYPGNEAHGGYAFCGLAAAVLLDEAETALDLDGFLHWCAECQMSIEGGFQGRTNKLVDACYSFWMGGTFPLFHAVVAALPSHLHHVLGRSPEKDHTYNHTPSSSSSSSSGYDPNHLYMLDEQGLQEYLLLACQTTTGSGGLRDKPPKYPDFYHTCYGLSGLAIAQHGPDGRRHVLGHPDNELRETDVIHNVVVGRAAAMRERNTGASF